MSALIDIKTEAAGRWSSVLLNLGIAEQHLSGKHTSCPLCGGKDRFRWDRKIERAYCSACGHKGPLDLAIAFLERPYREVVIEVRTVLGVSTVEPIKNTDDSAKNLARIERIRPGLKPLTGECLASRYLANRGLSVLPEKDCYLHPGVAYWNGEEKAVLPAMVSIFRNLEGKGATMHITYLGSDGRKAEVEAPKKILPVVFPVTGCAIQLFKPVDGVLAVAEGVETALAVHQDQGIPVWAAGNANNMANMQLPKDVKEVWIYADVDPSFTGQQAAFSLAKRMASEGKQCRVAMHRNEATHVAEFVDSGLKLDFLDALLLMQHDKRAQSATAARR